MNKYTKVTHGITTREITLSAIFDQPETVIPAGSPVIYQNGQYDRFALIWTGDRWAHIYSNGTQPTGIFTVNNIKA